MLLWEGAHVDVVLVPGTLEVGVLLLVLSWADFVDQVH